MYKDLITLRLQIGNWTVYGERHLNSDKLTHSSMNAPPFSNSLPTHGEKEEERKKKEKKRKKRREKKKKKIADNITAGKLTGNAAGQKIRGR